MHEEEPLMFGRQKRQDREIVQVMSELKDRGWDAEAMAVLPAEVRKRVHEAQERAKKSKK